MYDCSTVTSSHLLYQLYVLLLMRLMNLDGVKYRLHANQIRPYNVRADEVTFDSRAFDDQSKPKANVVKFPQVEDGNNYDGLCEMFKFDSNVQAFIVSTCVHDEDTDFGELQPCELRLASDLTDSMTESGVSLPSQKIDLNSLAHLTETQQKELLEVLDKYPDVFDDEPGLCKIFEHKIPVTPDFKPKRLKGYCVPEKLKPEVDRQITGMLNRGIIRRYTFPMASPIICVLKGPGGKDGVRIVCDFRYLKRFTVSDAYPIVDIQDIIQRIGNSTFLSTFDCSCGYHQTLISPSDRWQTGFIFDNELYEWNRTAFGHKSSGCTFCRNLQYVHQPLKRFAEANVDDAVVHSGEWQRHLEHINTFLLTMREFGITLKLKKCQFALSEIKFCGQLVGSGTRRADPDKISAIKKLKLCGLKPLSYGYSNSHGCSFGDNKTEITSPGDGRVDGPGPNHSERGDPRSTPALEALTAKGSTHTSHPMTNETAVEPPCGGRTNGDRDSIAGEEDTGNDLTATQRTETLTELRRQTDSTVNTELTADAKR